ncbi:MAG: 50S ribosomal protein L29 [Saprospiraceae bacterium]|jgi:large subunit ribosomal protein L29|nr:50S ribosomal protein L29 [Saprospiraceae bacterium]MBP9209249.1 50S ribosomal protein L29 [Saprospiraceae bacterium]MBV6473026.1 50S ribosomal protein L29 [Saprospiraceae bacterium]
MALKKYTEFAGLDNEVLERDLRQAVEELSRLRVEHKVKGLQNPVQIRHLRKEIAKMKTEMTKRSSTHA